MMWTKIKQLFGWVKDRMSWKVARRISLGVVLFVFFYYLIGMVVVENIDNSKNFAADKLNENAPGSHAVAMSIAMVDREVNTHAWISNDPWFKPGALLDNMANFQKGMVSANAIFAIELKDQLSRTRGSSQVNVDLQEVASGMNYAPDKWYWDPTVSIFLFVAPAEKQYNSALSRLKIYNQSVAAGEAPFERRADNLLSTLDKISLDLGSSSDSISKKIDNGIGCVLDTKADDLFYDVKGRSYAYWLLLKGLRMDFAKVINDKDIVRSWDQLEESMAALIDLDPMIVSNCAADGFMFQNHLSAQGFYLLRARTQLKEITNILLK
ncbi:DUF2333 family protein [Paremcibacter congregatus]|uniref:DUF2333 domain-containing protein n=1 Tax=Paremcibacter congregatus TaxID=2043170 RepID=A0A2G4YUP0_9PROT|nr:DUF2333 family protein [Paremcibacter congregatus]PHZ86003.1 hypothetical protein CRD36_04845 [Paremcibacter congregatus]QDE26968.1 DUF2333 family protein [Paremcibacter congregatus]